MINSIIIEVNRYQATEYLLKNFYDDQSIIEHHLDFIEKDSNNRTKQILKQYFNNSCQLPNINTLRMLSIISEDNLTVQCILNENNNLKYRIIAIRFLDKPIRFQNEFRTILNNEQEPSELRISCFQAIHQSLTSSEIDNLIETIQARQVRSYIKSLLKKSSIWLANSGSYEFPFGKVNVIFNEKFLLYFPTVIQLNLRNNTEIGLYFIRSNGQTMV